MNAVSLMALPFLECLVLVGIHSYLGLHVIRRRVIFVDLALAQVAALGTTVAFLFGLNPHSTGAYLFSLAFTFLGAAVFSLTRLRKDRVPQEAVIGLSYALAASVGILAVYGAPHGAEHIQNISTGSLLWVTAEDVWKAAAAYAVVGALHFLFRKPFRLISEDPEEARRQGLRVRWWDFLFYLLFGLVITHSVQTAGVLLVFVFLVVPAILGVMLTDRMGLQLAIGWVVGTAVSVIGLAFSYWGDLPSGPTVVAFYGLALLLAALAVYVIRAPERLRALGHVVAGAAVVVVLGLAFAGAGRFMAGVPALAQGPEHERAADSEAHARGHAAPVEGGAPGEAGVSGDAGGLAGLTERLSGLDLVEKRRAMRGVESAGDLARLADAATDVEVRFVAAERLLELARADGTARLLGLMSDPATPPLFRDEALHALMAALGVADQGFDPWSSPDGASNRAALEAWRSRAQQ
mgnify:CR=1 FL=1